MSTTQNYPLALVAWTGGDTPRTADIGDKRAPLFRAMRRVLFREQVETWRNAWGDSPNRDTLRIFHKRATLDAWRSYTERDDVRHSSPASARGNILANGRAEILADGYSVSAYALRCGAVQSSERIGRRGWRVELYTEHGAHHVRAFDHAKRDAGEPLDAWRTWQSFTLGELSKARAAAFRMLRAFGWHDVRRKRGQQ